MKYLSMSFHYMTHYLKHTRELFTLFWFGPDLRHFFCKNPCTNITVKKVSDFHASRFFKSNFFTA
jgi:hypothetical protein